MLLDSWGTTSFLWATRKSTAPVRRSRFFSSLPDRRIEVRFGKFSIVDFFDTNTYGTDTTLQFMNWTVDNNGAYDYAADTRAFTFAAMFEYHERRWAVRFAEALMPKVANGIHLDADKGRARAEFEVHGTVLRHQEGIICFLSFVSHANMGSYREAIDNFLAGDNDQAGYHDSSAANITRSMFGGEFILRSACSTSTIPDTIGT